MVGACLSVRRGCGQMLGNPPGLVTKLAVEARDSLTICAASTGYRGEHVFTKTRQQLRANLRPHVLSRRILGCGFKFLLKFCVLAGVEFKEKTGAVLERHLLRIWQCVVF